MISPGKIPFKVIPYSIQIIIYKPDIKNYEKNINDINRRINNSIEKIEFHEKIHCFLYRFLRIPSMIVYLFRYSPYFMANGAFTMPMKPLTKLQYFLADILHFFWELIYDFFTPKKNQINTRSPVKLIQKLKKNFIERDGFEDVFKFQSIEDMQDYLYQISDDIVMNWEKGKPIDE